LSAEEKRPPDALYQEMRRIHSDLHALVQRLRRCQDKMGLSFDHLDRWEEGDYELRRAVSRCFNHTTQLMDVCSSGVLSVLALEGAQKQWDLLQETPAPEEVEESLPQVQTDTEEGSDLPYRAELYRPLREDPEMEGVLGLYSEDDEESDDSEDDEDEDDEDDEEIDDE